MRARPFTTELNHVTAAPPPAEVAPYLGPTPGIDPASPTVRALATTLRGSDSLASVRSILRWLKANLRYELLPAGNGRTVERTLEKRAGECGCYAALFTALCRALGLPAREVWGVVKPAPGFLPPGLLSGHVWSEVYLSGVGWIPLDPQDPASLGFLGTGSIRLCHYTPSSAATWAATVWR